jgi:bacteriocin-type transport-associated protein
MFNVFNSLPKNLEEWLFANGETIETGTEADLITEGEHPEYLYILLSGTVKVITAKGAEFVELATLESGEMFGEMSFLESRPPVATIRPVTRCKILRLSRKRLSEALKNKPAVSKEFFQLTAQKLAAQLNSQNHFIHRWPGIDIEPVRKVLIIFSILSEIDIEWISKNGTKQSYTQGEYLIRQGDPVPGLLIVLAGDAEVSIISQGSAQPVGSSRRGEFLGEMTLLGASDTATASVKATTNMEIYKIDKAVLINEFEKNDRLASRFYNSLSVLISQRLRDQLRSRGFATRAFAEEDHDSDSLSIEQMSSITTAGQRFEWLCQNILSP